jgi:hypothetical protein
MAMLVAEKRILRTLQSGGAIDEPSAVEYEPPTFLHTFRLKRLLAKGAVVRTPSDKFFLDQTGYAAYRAGRRRRAIVIIGVALLLVLLLLWYEENKPKPGEDSQYTLVTRTAYQ